MTEQLLWTVAEAARALGLSEDYVRRLVREGRVPHRRLGDGPRARIRFSRKDLERFVDSIEEPTL